MKLVTTFWIEWRSFLQSYFESILKLSHKAAFTPFSLAELVLALYINMKKKGWSIIWLCKDLRVTPISTGLKWSGYPSGERLKETDLQGMWLEVSLTFILHQQGVNNSQASNHTDNWAAYSARWQKAWLQNDSFHSQPEHWEHENQAVERVPG